MIEIKGLDELQSNLKKMERKAKAMDGTHNVALEDVLTKSFLRKRTRFSSLDQIMELVDVKTKEDFENLDEPELDKVVKSHSSFRSWQQMLEEASAEWMSAKIFS